MKLFTYLKPAINSKQLWTLAFVGATPLMILAPALFTTEVAVQTTKIPFSQLAELIIPFSVIAFFYAGMIGAFLDKQRTTALTIIWLMLSFLILGMLGIGQGIHFSAQTLNHFVVTNEIFGELRDVAYLFNEKLTHLIWLPAVISFPIIVAGWELLVSETEKKMKSFSIGLGTAAGSWYGLITGLAILEAQLAKFAFGWLVLLIILSGGASLFRKKLFNLGPVIAIVSNLVTLGILVLWRLKFGGFPEPLDVLGL
jgi:hypothetical protein